LLFESRTIWDAPTVIKVKGRAAPESKRSVCEEMKEVDGKASQRGEKTERRSAQIDSLAHLEL